ncbi:hypothetical protein PGT21_021181 [Puccinia graminis f. sp. tritici]|uniref:Uncharacterized protein n=1 Tax=Puccinia graminis f. sp. tritici TaxID=56615 RepID=A0A5B0LQJ8_PUCGR|nr:hypothetical protein PGTUg99_003858 [Puccinia graminis f. sp. tritici]KAA1071847.1 hypothetical protein PGT21_021181 [Puccinia graminis f. sp. tritici]
MHSVKPYQFTKCRILPTPLDLKVSLGFPSTLPVQTSSVAAKRHVSVSGASEVGAAPGDSGLSPHSSRPTPQIHVLRPAGWFSPAGYIQRLEGAFTLILVSSPQPLQTLPASIAKLFYRYYGIVGRPQN